MRESAGTIPVLSSKGRDWRAAVAFTASQTDKDGVEYQDLEIVVNKIRDLAEE